eukprot:1360327-Amorphochlora_amoeboformis.AAC.1
MCPKIIIKFGCLQEGGGRGRDTVERREGNSVIREGKGAKRPSPHLSFAQSNVGVLDPSVG